MSAFGTPAAVAAPLSRSPQRKSPPPSSLNLDQLRPMFAPASVYHAPPAPATPGGTTTSFIFTSSRTKQLQSPLGSPFASSSTANNARPPSPVRPRRSRSPVSPSASVSTASTVRNHQRAKATLTPTQLARHGEGAMDSRRILGPNMRAAGFVHLSNAVKSNSGSAATSPASSPGWQEIPGPSNYMGKAPLQLTPTDPPPFPPIMFVPPTAVQQVSMWDYQRWPLEHAHTTSPPTHTHVRPHLPADVAKTSQGRSVSESHTMASAGLGALHARALSHSPFSFGSSSDSSGPSLAQVRSISFSSTSTMFSPEGRRAAEKGKDRECDGPEVLDEYPFPRTPPSPSSRASNSSSPTSGSGGRDSEERSGLRATAADSPELASNAARNRDRSARSSQPHSQPRPKDKDRDRAKERERNRDKRRGGDRLTERIQEQLNVPRAARPGVNIAVPHAKPRAHELSFSELCEPGFAWSTANPDIFAPVHGPRALESTTESPSPPTDLEKESPELATSALEAAQLPALVPVEKERHREQRREEKKHIAGLVAAHRERDEDHVRYVAAAREREEREGKKDREKGKERARGSPKGSGRTSPVPAITITKEREHREREWTSPGHKERKSRRHSPKHLHAVHKAKSVFSDIASVSDAETMVGDAETMVGDAETMVGDATANVLAA